MKGGVTLEESKEENHQRARAISFTSNRTIEVPIQDPLDIPPNTMFAPIPPGNDETPQVFEDNIQTTIRRMCTDPTPPQNTPILIIDNAADMSMIGQGFQIMFHTGETTTLWGAMASLDGNIYDVVCATAVIQSPASEQAHIIIINQAAYLPDNKQFESLLHADQARHHNVVVNDLGKFFRDGNGKPGKQSIEVDGYELPLQHDGSKYFFSIRTPTTADWNNLPIIELTSPTPWDQQRCQIR